MGGNLRAHVGRVRAEALPADVRPVAVARALLFGVVVGEANLLAVGGADGHACLALAFPLPNVPYLPPPLELPLPHPLLLPLLGFLPP